MTSCGLRRRSASAARESSSNRSERLEHLVVLDADVLGALLAHRERLVLDHRVQPPVHRRRIQPVRQQRLGVLGDQADAEDAYQRALEIFVKQVRHGGHRCSAAPFRTVLLGKVEAGTPDH